MKSGRREALEIFLSHSVVVVVQENTKGVSRLWRRQPKNTAIGCDAL